MVSRFMANEYLFTHKYVRSAEICAHSRVQWAKNENKEWNEKEEDAKLWRPKVCAPFVFNSKRRFMRTNG